MINQVNRENIPHCLFLGDLSAFCTEIARSKKAANKHLMFGFLGYEEESSAAEAINYMDGQVVCGRAIKVMWSTSSQVKTSPNVPESFYLKITNIPVNCTVEDLRQLFHDIPSVASIDLFHTSQSRTVARHKQPYGLVQFENASTAATAMKQLDGQLFYGKSLTVKWATQSVQAKKKAKALLEAQKQEEDMEQPDISLFVSFVAVRPDIQITEETLRDVFGVFGEIEDVAIRLSLFDDVTHVQKGYGFVYFDWKHQGRMAGIQAALRASEMFFVDQEVRQVVYHVELSNKLKKEVGMVNNDDTTNMSTQQTRSVNNTNSLPESRADANGTHHNNSSSLPHDMVAYMQPTMKPMMQQLSADTKQPPNNIPMQLPAGQPYHPNTLPAFYPYSYPVLMTIPGGNQGPMQSYIIPPEMLPYYPTPSHLQTAFPSIPPPPMLSTPSTPPTTPTTLLHHPSQYYMSAVPPIQHHSSVNSSANLPPPMMPTGNNLSMNIQSMQQPGGPSPPLGAGYSVSHQVFGGNKQDRSMYRNKVRISGPNNLTTMNANSNHTADVQGSATTTIPIMTVNPNYQYHQQHPLPAGTIPYSNKQSPRQYQQQQHHHQHQPQYRRHQQE